MSAPLFRPDELPDQVALGQDEGNASVRRAREYHQRRAAASGLSLVTDDGFTIEGDPDVIAEATSAPAPRARADDFDPDADEIDLELDGRSRVVNLRLRDGEVLRLEIPALTVDKLDRIEWYMEKYRNRSAEMHKQTDVKRADTFAEQRRKYSEAMIRYIIPDFPHGLLDGLSVKSWNRLNAIVQSMQREALADAKAEAGTDPNFA